jgi:hypothetical protein
MQSGEKQKENQTPSVIKQGILNEICNDLTVTESLDINVEKV